MNVQPEMGTFAEMASASTQWGPSSVNAMKAMRWLQMEGPVWVSAASESQKEIPKYALWDERILQSLSTSFLQKAGGEKIRVELHQSYP